MAQIRLRIVGESLIELGARQLKPEWRQLFALLLVLGVDNHRNFSRSELIELLYSDDEPPHDPPHDPPHRLRQLLYRARRMGAPLSLAGGSVRVNAGDVINAHAQLLNGGWEARRAHLTLGFEMLPHYSVATGTPLDRWLETHRQQSHLAMRQQLIGDFAIARRRADWRYLESLARGALELDPLNETAILALAEATARLGSKALAVSILDAYRSELGEARLNLSLPASLLEKRIEASRERSMASRRALVPMVGRERELAALLAQWQSARQGTASLVTLTGNKSVGKSRLAEEFASNALLGGSGHVITLGMSPTDQDRPLSLFAGLANRLSSLPGAAGCHPSSFQALGRLSGSIPLPAAVNPENTNSTYSDVAVRNAICDLVACVCDERAVLVIVDDAEHLDEASAQLLDTMLSRVSDKRLMVLLCGTSARCAPLQHLGTLHLDALSTSPSEELWRSLLAAHDIQLSDATTQTCLDAAAGNPGHLEMLAQQAIQEPDHFLIPVDLITLTDHRLSQLPVHARYALEAIVILDDAATTSSVAYLTGLSTYELLTALHALEEGDWIMNTPTGVRCRSGLITERVRATSSGTVTSLMEGRAATYFEEEQSGDRWSPTTAWRIAAHWQRAGEPRKARAYQRACWQHAVSIGQPMRASTAIGEVLATTADPEDRAPLLDDLIGSLLAAGDLKAVVPAVIERRRLSPRVHDTASRAAQLAFDEDEAQWTRNANPEVSVDSFRRHLESPLLNPHRRLRAARLLIMAAEGDLDRELANYTITNCQNISADDLHSQLLLRYVGLIYHTIFGDASHALRIADDIQAATRQVERSWYTLMLDRNCAFARQLVGTDPSDIGCYERGFAQALDASMTAIALWFAGSLMSVLVDNGDLAGARSWRTTAEGLAEAFAGEDLPIDYLGAQIDLALLESDFKKARLYLGLTQECARYQTRRLRNELFIYRLRVEQFSNSHLATASEIEQLLEYHELGKGLTRHDDHVAVMWEALNAVGETRRASALLSDYLILHRRERRPPRYMLRLRTQNDPAWEQVSAKEL